MLRNIFLKPRSSRRKSLGTHRRRAIERLEARTLLAAGALDLTFGTGGLVSTDLFSGSDDFGGQVLLTDGKILVSGISDGGFSQTRDTVVARYNSDGSLDGSFGVGGIAFAGDIASNDSLGAMKVQSDGRIVLAGTLTTGGGDEKFALSRLNSDGTLDDGTATDSTPGDEFGTDGVVLVDVKPGGRENCHQMVIQPDGKIVGVGFVVTGRVARKLKAS